MRQVGSVLWPNLKVVQIYGANTGVGKTIFSSILCRAFQNRIPQVHYLKPISTGPLDEADDRHVSTLSRQIQSKCLYQFSEPVSPHIAARSSTQPVADDAIRIAVYDELNKYACTGDGAAIVETAGGVLSPSPSGNSQADLYRSLRLPVFLVGDHRLGGIGTTISAWESLHIRGYDVRSVALFEADKYENHSYLKDYFAERGVASFSIPPPPERRENPTEDAQSMRQYYDNTSGRQEVDGFISDFLDQHSTRIRDLQALPSNAHQAIWHPFMQHRERSKDTIIAMDSAYGDYFDTYTTKQALTSERGEGHNLLKPAFDGSASWWTQGLGHGNPRLALTAAHAAGRYGHVMFASAVHEPALTLAQTLIEKMGNPRLSKVFYTDNGSTGMEVAVKMALRAATVRNGWNAGDEIVILGFKNSYHGDTIGTMDCSEPSIYNQKVEWYRGRGHWLDFPQVQMRQGKWVVEIPQELNTTLGPRRVFESLDNVFDLRNRSEDQKIYRAYFDDELARLRKQGKKLGALVMEPVILGAGGMMLADPLYQRCLVEAVREASHESVNDGLDWKGMPVVFDEVFTGLYRLGRFSAASFLDLKPDIVVNAKLLTGGLLPLCTTTASEAIFEAFLSDDKSDALLHGHSYTAHPVGCAVGNDSLQTMMKMDRDGTWDVFRSEWQPVGSKSHVPEAVSQPGVWSMWSPSFLSEISRQRTVEHVFAIGSVFAVSLKDAAGSGYASTAATGLRDQLLAGPVEDGWVIHSRVLGNVLYLMAAMTTSQDAIRSIERRILAAIA